MATNGLSTMDNRMLSCSRIYRIKNEHSHSRVFRKNWILFVHSLDSLSRWLAHSPPAKRSITHTHRAVHDICDDSRRIWGHQHLLNFFRVLDKIWRKSRLELNHITYIALCCDNAEAVHVVDCDCSSDERLPFVVIVVAAVVVVAAEPNEPAFLCVCALFFVFRRISHIHSLSRSLARSLHTEDLSCIQI